MTPSKKKFVAVLIALSATFGSAAGMLGHGGGEPLAAKPGCAIGGLLGGGGGC